MVALPEPAQHTVNAIYAAYEAKAEDGFRAHLGASQIGNPCERALWYSFRWATHARHDGRMLRLFETGHMAEARFVANLRAIGVEIHEVDPETGRQWQMRDETGHFGGSMDGAGVGLPEAPKTWHVFEFKTHSEKSFTKLKADGVHQAKPLHWEQMQVYMHLSGMTRAFYLAVNKNTDELYQERIKYYAAEGARLMAKAARIIRAKTPPGRISEDPAWFQCRFCDHHAVCHFEVAPERHCRSCVHVTPADGGTWTCAEQQCVDVGWHDGTLTIERQKEGCQFHLFNPGFIDGEVEDAGETWIQYRLRDGSVWKDERCPF